MHTQSHQRPTAQDIMSTDVITIEPNANARELARVLTDNDISGVPVMDIQDRIIGVVSKTDLLHWCVTGGSGRCDDDLFEALGRRANDQMPQNLGTVDDFMSTEPITARADESIKSIARRMASERVHRVIVVDDDQCVIGIVTSLDLLKALSH